MGEDIPVLVEHQVRQLAALGVDVEKLSYRPLAEIHGVPEKAARDAGVEVTVVADYDRATDELSPRAESLKGLAANVGAEYAAEKAAELEKCAHQPLAERDPALLQDTKLNAEQEDMARRFTLKGADRFEGFGELHP